MTTPPDIREIRNRERRDSDAGLSVVELEMKYDHSEYGHEHPRWSRAQFKKAVAAGRTLHSYWYWVHARVTKSRS